MTDALGDVVFRLKSGGLGIELVGVAWREVAPGPGVEGPSDEARDNDVAGPAGAGLSRMDHPNRAVITAVSDGSATSRGAEDESSGASGPESDGSSRSRILSCNLTDLMIF